MKRYRIHFLYLILLGLYTPMASAQRNPEKLRVGMHSEYFAVNDLRSAYGATLGADVDFFLFNKKFLHVYSTAGFTTDIGARGANMYASSLGLGYQFNFNEIIEPKIFIQFSLSGMYWHEKFTTEFAASKVSSSHSALGSRIQFGGGYYINEAISIRLNGIQYHTYGIGVGLGLNYTIK